MLLKMTMHNLEKLLIPWIHPRKSIIILISHVIKIRCQRPPTQQRGNLLTSPMFTKTIKGLVNNK